jgi:Protein of unknown function (DUF2971)
MRLYYMTTLETLEQFVLPELRIRVSTFDRVNDPFELLGMSQTNRDSRRHFAALYDLWVKTLGFVSFSDNWKSPLMWGHYARNHTGVCLGIEIPTERVIPMNYQAERLEVLLSMSPLDAAVDDDLIKQIVTTKFRDWAYEREWRYLTKLEHPDKDTGFHYIEFSPEFELREIIAGARCERSLADLRRLVFGNTEAIKVLKARAAFGFFGMVRQTAELTLTISPFHQTAGFSGRTIDRSNRDSE